MVVFTDNDAVRDSLIGCRTSSENASEILEACLRQEFSLALNLWVARVPTDSNVADDPSRNVSDGLLKRGTNPDPLDLDKLWQLLKSSTEGEATTSSFVPNCHEKELS